jgi:hypothetical protein
MKGWSVGAHSCFGWGSRERAKTFEKTRPVRPYVSPARVKICQKQPVRQCRCLTMLQLFVSENVRSCGFTGLSILFYL